MSLFLWCVRLSLAFMFQQKRHFPCCGRNDQVGNTVNAAWKKKRGLKKKIVPLLKVGALYPSGTSHTFSGIPREEAFISSCFMQMRFYWTQQSRDTISSFANLLASLQRSGVTSPQDMPHTAEAPLFSRRPLSSSVPGDVYPHDTIFHQIHPALAFGTQYAILKFINLDSDLISKLRLGEIRKQKRELRRQSLQGTTAKSFFKFTKEPKPEQSLLEFTLHNDLGNHGIPGSWSACLFLNSERVEEYCQIFQTPELAHH